MCMSMCVCMSNAACVFTCLHSSRGLVLDIPVSIQVTPLIFCGEILNTLQLVQFQEVLQRRSRSRKANKNMTSIIVLWFEVSCLSNF